MNYQAGNTIRLVAQFKDWNDEPKDPTSVKINIFDSKYNLLSENTLDDYNWQSEGKYFYDFIPEASGEYIYEWVADMDGTPNVKRSRIRINLV